MPVQDILLHLSRTPFCAWGPTGPTRLEPPPPPTKPFRYAPTPVQHTPAPPDVACAWVMANGMMVGVDTTFSDWFGHQDRDLPPGTYLSSLVADNKALTK